MVCMVNLESLIHNRHHQTLLPMQNKNLKMPLSVIHFTLFPTLLVTSLFIELFLKLGWSNIFSYHPAFMLLAFGVAIPYAIITKRTTGMPSAARLHAKAMGLAALFALVGYTAVFINKEQRNKKHLTSWHALMGIVLLIMTVFQPISSYIWLHPDSQFRLHFSVNGNLIRVSHRWAGRLMVLGAYAVCATGWWKLHPEPLSAVVGLVILAITLLVPLVITLPTTSSDSAYQNISSDHANEMQTLKMSFSQEGAP